MLGVDFVISALFDTSGFRAAGDCAAALVMPITANAQQSRDKLIRRTRPTVMPGTRSQRAKKKCSRRQ
jgi:hypothetical protein